MLLGVVHFCIFVKIFICKAAGVCCLLIFCVFILQMEITGFSQAQDDLSSASASAFPGASVEPPQGKFNLF